MASSQTSTLRPIQFFFWGILGVVLSEVILPACTFSQQMDSPFHLSKDIAIKDTEMWQRGNRKGVERVYTKNGRVILREISVFEDDKLIIKSACFVWLDSETHCHGGFFWNQVASWLTHHIEKTVVVDLTGDNRADLWINLVGDNDRVSGAFFIDTQNKKTVPILGGRLANARGEKGVEDVIDHVRNQLAKFYGSNQIASPPKASPERPVFQDQSNGRYRVTVKTKWVGGQGKQRHLVQSFYRLKGIIEEREVFTENDLIKRVHTKFFDRKQNCVAEIVATPALFQLRTLPDAFVDTYDWDHNWIFDVLVIANDGSGNDDEFFNVVDRWTIVPVGGDLYGRSQQHKAEGMPADWLLDELEKRYLEGLRPKQNNQSGQNKTPGSK